MSLSLPPADGQYLAAVDRAFWDYGRAMLALLKPYTREPDMRRAREAYNAATPAVIARFHSDITAAQVALRARAESPATCEGCGEPMTIIEPGQRFHPMCDDGYVTGTGEEGDDW